VIILSGQFTDSGISLTFPAGPASEVHFTYRAVFGRRRQVKNFIAIAYLRLARLEKLPAYPFGAATAGRYECRAQHETA
jgi:hypothetical protein